MLFSRTSYLSRLKRHQDSNFIKVITGIRRVGKSTILSMFVNTLLESGIKEKQIIQINLEKIIFEDLCEYHALNDYIAEKTKDSTEKYYVFVDEIQNCHEFQKAIRSLYSGGNVDFYISGSNAYLLSGELSTLLSGRYVEIEIFPLSFAEYSEAFPEEDAGTLFKKYLKTGGFPTNLDSSNQEDELSAILSSIVMKDILLRNPQFSAPMLQKVIRYVANSIGSPISTKNMANVLNSSGEKTSQSEIELYLESLCLCYFFQSANNFDVTGKNILRDNHKFYIIDCAMRNILVKSSKNDYGHILENLVFLELRRRGFQALVGSTSGFEIDFVAQKLADTVYIQVSATIQSSETLERELRPLQSISHEGEKILLTMDENTGDYDDIQMKNIVDWLLENKI